MRAYIDFKRGSIFEYVDVDTEQEFRDLKAYDTKDKIWRHLNFFLNMNAIYTQEF